MSVCVLLFVYVICRFIDCAMWCDQVLVCVVGLETLDMSVYCSTDN